MRNIQKYFKKVNIDKVSKNKIDRFLETFELYTLIKAENIRKKFSEDFLLKVVNGDKKSIKKLVQFSCEHIIPNNSYYNYMTVYWCVHSYVDLVNKKGAELFLEILLKDFYLKCFVWGFCEFFSFLHKVVLEELEGDLVDITYFPTSVLAKSILVNEERMTLNEMGYRSERDKCFFLHYKYQEEYDDIVIRINKALDEYKKIINENDET